MSGWGTFTIEHLIFGLVTGLVVAAWRPSASDVTQHLAGRDEPAHIGGRPS